MSFLASGIGGLFSLGASLIGADAARSNVAKELKVEQQQAVASNDQLKMFMVIGAGGLAVFVVVYLIADSFEWAVD